MTYRSDCSFFSGYKPCRFKRPCTDCPHYKPIEKRILIISLEAMGAVLRSTCLLPAIKRKYENSHITWITLPISRSLLENNPYIDRLLTLKPDILPLISYLEFDVVYAVDKSLEAGSLAQIVKGKEKFGFGLSPQGVIEPLNPEAHYQYDVGLNDELKFFINQKAETQQITESMALTWERDPYILELTSDEKSEVQKRRDEMLQLLPTKPRALIGYNTGCSTLFPYKKFTLEFANRLITEWRTRFPDCAVVLLGGPEDTERQEQMKQAFAHDPMVINSPTTGGLRSGILWIDTCDMVLSGCSLGMHMAIGLKKPVLAWFGVSCIQEVDLYDRGIKLQTKATCSPCWQKTCAKDVKCYDLVSLSEISDATAELIVKAF